MVVFDDVVYIFDWIDSSKVKFKGDKDLSEVTSTHSNQDTLT